MASNNNLSSETQTLLSHRVSTRKYKDKAVSAEMIDAVLEAAMRAPTSSNIQAYSVVVVRDPERLRSLSTAAGNQGHVRDTPVFVAFCADLTRIQQAMVQNQKSIDPNNLELGLVSTIDAALVGMSASLVAESFGLKGVMIGAVRNDPQEVARILGLPKGAYCVFGMCLGWPDEAPQQKPRMSPSQTVHYEQYGEHNVEHEPAQQLSDYDNVLRTHYQAIDKPTTTNSWTDEIAKKFNPQPRDGLRAALHALGFDFT